MNPDCHEPKQAQLVTQTIEDDQELLFGASMLNRDRSVRGKLRARHHVAADQEYDSGVSAVACTCLHSMLSRPREQTRL